MFNSPIKVFPIKEGRPLAQVNNFLVFARLGILGVYNIATHQTIPQKEDIFVRNLIALDNDKYMYRPIFSVFHSMPKDIHLTKEGILSVCNTEPSDWDTIILTSWAPRYQNYYISSPMGIFPAGFKNKELEVSPSELCLKQTIEKLRQLRSEKDDLFVVSARCRKYGAQYVIYKKITHGASDDTTDIFLLNSLGDLLGVFQDKPGLVGDDFKVGIYGRYVYIGDRDAIHTFDLQDIQRPTSSYIYRYNCVDRNFINVEFGSNEIFIGNSSIVSIPYIEVAPGNFSWLPKRLQGEIIATLWASKHEPFAILPKEIVWIILGFLV